MWTDLWTGEKQSGLDTVSLAALLYLYCVLGTLSLRIVRMKRETSLTDASVKRAQPILSLTEMERKFANYDTTGEARLTAKVFLFLSWRRIGGFHTGRRSEKFDSCCSLSLHSDVFWGAAAQESSLGAYWVLLPVLKVNAPLKFPCRPCCNATFNCGRPVRKSTWRARSGLPQVQLFAE